MEYQKRINGQLLGLNLKKDVIQGNIPTNMLVGGGPLRDFIIPGNSTADVVLEGSVGGSKFTKGFKRGFEDAAKDTFRIAKRIGKPVVKQVKKDVKALKKAAVGDLSGVASAAYDTAKDEAIMSLVGAGKRKVAVKVGPVGVKIGGAKPQSAWIKHVKAYQAKHGCSYKDAMKNAKATYR